MRRTRRIGFAVRLDGSPPAIRARIYAAPRTECIDLQYPPPQERGGFFVQTSMLCETGDGAEAVCAACSGGARKL